jgi:hypothetical protein
MNKETLAEHYHHELIMRPAYEHSEPTAFWWLHRQACLDLLGREAPCEDFFLDLKQLEGLDVGQIALVHYSIYPDSQIRTGHCTHVTTQDSQITHQVNLCLPYHPLIVFERTGSEQDPRTGLSVATGRTYRLNLESRPSCSATQAAIPNLASIIQETPKRVTPALKDEPRFSI